MVASLFSTLVTFRLGSAVLSADMAKFYNQTQLDPGLVAFNIKKYCGPGTICLREKRGGEGEGAELEPVSMVVETLTVYAQGDKNVLLGRTSSPST